MRNLEHWLVKCQVTQLVSGRAETWTLFRESQRLHPNGPSGSTHRPSGEDTLYLIFVQHAVHLCPGSKEEWSPPQFMHWSLQIQKGHPWCVWLIATEVCCYTTNSQIDKGHAKDMLLKVHEKKIQSPSSNNNEHISDKYEAESSSKDTYVLIHLILLITTMQWIPSPAPFYQKGK